jgi:division protein CdvB (Snf7/Vps24/ESCRT-III family)
MVQFELDQHGGSICATVEFPLEDSTLTENQMIRAIYAVVRILEYYHPVIQTAIDSGEVDFSVVEEQDSVMQMMHQILETVGLDDDESDESVEKVLEVSEEESESSSDDLGDFI